MKSNSEYIIQLRRLFHKKPELGFREHKTAQIIMSELDKKNIKYKSGIGGTGIIAQLGSGYPHIAYRAEMDALPIMENNQDIDYASENNGVMHACGHDGHMAILLGVIDVLKQEFEDRTLNGRISFIFQPCEETRNQSGETGAQTMLKYNGLDDVDSFFAIHLESTLTSGQVFIREKSVTSIIDRFDIEIIGKAGHGAYPHKAIDPIWITSQVISSINSIQSRCIDTNSPSIISICTINGGNAWNVIPDKVSLSGTIRTFSEQVREDIHNKIEDCLNISKSLGGSYILKIEKGNPTVKNDSDLCKLVKESAALIIGNENIREIDLQMGGDDFSYYSLLKPSCYFYFGAKKDSISRQHHSSNFNIDERSLSKCADIFINIALNSLHINNG